jgi:hypothetical protein
MRTHTEISEVFRRYRITIAILATLVLALSAEIVWVQYPDCIPGYKRSRFQSDAPHVKAIKKIVEPLRYSGVQDFMRPEVRLSLDFAKEEWTIHNLHRFDEAGNVLLNEGQSAICGDLAAYTYQKIRPLFGPGYRIAFIKVAETSFFKSADNGSHVILSIIDATSSGQPKLYILDPAFGRYGSRERFPDYLFLERVERLPFMVEKRTDETFTLLNSTPVVINRKVLLSLHVARVNGKFDPDNYRVVLSATKRYEYEHTEIFAFNRINGRNEIFETQHNVASLMRPGRYQLLKNQLIKLANNARLSD